ncbi:MAG: hypothetical protein K2W95_36380 [Candidatus Obscuribacterales bacterium]|nr:hypothetical protein [Candidatus Obscuribacterales bacterium]
MIPSMRAYLQAVAAVANARANLPTAIDDDAQRALDDANAAADRVRNGLLATPFNLSGFGNGPTFLPVDDANHDVNLEFGLEKSGSAEGHAGKKSIGEFGRGFRRFRDVAVVAVDLNANDFPHGQTDLFGDLTTDNINRPEASERPAESQFLPTFQVDPVRIRRIQARLSAGLALQTGTAFEKKVFAIAFLEQQLRRLNVGPTRPCDDNINEHTHFKIRELPNDADAHALTALQQTRVELKASPPETDDQLENSYYRWVLADLEYERLQAQAREEADGNNDGLADAMRIRTEALVSFVAASAA